MTINSRDDRGRTRSQRAAPAPSTASRNRKMTAGTGGTLLSINQQAINPNTFSWEFSLVFVVVVVTTGVNTPEGAIQAGFGYVVLQQLLTYVPGRIGGNSLLIVFFAFGALTYVAHPEGILEFQKRRWTLRFERLLLRKGTTPVPPGSDGGTPALASGPAVGG